MDKTDDWDMSKIEEKEYKHGEEVNLPHRFFTDYWNRKEDICDGKVIWEDVLEGFVCDKCALYTGCK